LILILTWLEIFSLEESNTFFERDFFNLEKEFLVLWSGSLTTWREPSLFRCNLSLLLEQLLHYKTKKPAFAGFS